MAQYEKEKLAETLMAIIWKDKGIEALADTYQRYCNGQRFLRTLGYKYGKQFAESDIPKKSRLLIAESARVANQEALFEQVYPDVSAEAKRLLGLLLAERIQFTGTYTIGGCPEYVEQ